MDSFNSEEGRLLDRYLKGTATQEEVKQLFSWLRNYPAESIEQLEQILEENYAGAFTRKPYLHPEESERVLSELISRIDQGKKTVPLFTRYKNRNRKRWYSVAAAVIAIVGLAVYFSVQKGITLSPGAVVSAPEEKQAPVSNKAVITLADGSKVFLDNVENGQLAQVGNIKLVKLADGQIAYQAANGQIMEELQYNTLTNPVGSKVIDMKLSDGSHVWLNAGSSISYPVAFAGNERKVVLEGEGYFEVAKDVGKRFIVDAGDVSTEVLGTHFNVNAYKDQGMTSITLLEGSVSVHVPGSKNGVEIRPGQQARVDRGINVVQTDIAQVMAWKEGKFNFGTGMDIHEVMKQVARWYGFQVEFEKDLTGEVGGRISRDVGAREVLELLEKTGSVRFKYGNSKITVMSP